MLQVRNSNRQAPHNQNTNQDKDNCNPSHAVNLALFHPVDNGIEQIVKQPSQNHWQHDDTNKLNHWCKNKANFAKNKNVQTDEQGHQKYGNGLII